ADALALLPNGAVVLALTEDAVELVQARLAEVSAPARGSAYELGGGRSIVFVAVAGGPPERDELALAQVLLAAHYLARFEGLPRVVQELPRDLERVLAELKL